MKEEQLDSDPLLPHLKEVSRIKHLILTNYLPGWAGILGSSSETLYYIDCFAGPGQYELHGESVDGSPVIAVKAAKKFTTANPRRKIALLLVDDKVDQLARLEKSLKPVEPYPLNMRVVVKRADSRDYIPSVVDKLRARGSAPAFFLVDPYNHPLSVPVLNDILARPKSEVFINLMWFQINRDISNPPVRHLVTELFGDSEWMSQPFVSMRGRKRERAFVEYFCSRLRAEFILPFRIKFDPEDRMRGHRTKYHLLHASNHRKAALLMKEVMWHLGDEEGTFEYSGVPQGVLISQTPKESELRDYLLQKFASQKLAFDDIRGLTWNLPFLEKHYRHVIQQLRAEGRVTVIPVSSKGKGLAARDLVDFREKA